MFSRRPIRAKAVVATWSAVALAGCATGGAKPPTIDLAPARDKITAAREAGAERSAPEPLSRAQAHLDEAEALVAASARNKKPGDDLRRAESLVGLSATEAEWALSLASRPAATAVTAPSCDEPSATRSDADARLRRAQEEQQRLEERAALLMRELELTETEVVRTKAKARGQTKAEASSAIAETHILLRRMADEKVKSPNLARSRELVDRAEELLQEGNVAGAVFFAMTAQDLVEQARKLAADPEGVEQPAPRAIVTAVGNANLREGPGVDARIVGRLPKGQAVQARAQRGDWMRVTFGRLDGWVYAPLLR